MGSIELGERVCLLSRGDRLKMKHLATSPNRFDRVYGLVGLSLFFVPMSLFIVLREPTLDEIHRPGLFAAVAAFFYVLVGYRRNVLHDEDSVQIRNSIFSLIPVWRTKIRKEDLIEVVAKKIRDSDNDEFHLLQLAYASTDSSGAQSREATTIVHRREHDVEESLRIGRQIAKELGIGFRREKA